MRIREKLRRQKSAMIRLKVNQRTKILAKRVEKDASRSRKKIRNASKQVKKRKPRVSSLVTKRRRQETRKT